MFRERDEQPGIRWGDQETSALSGLPQCSDAAWRVLWLAVYPLIVLFVFVCGLAQGQDAIVG